MEATEDPSPQKPRPYKNCILKTMENNYCLPSFTCRERAMQKGLKQKKKKMFVWGKSNVGIDQFVLQYEKLINQFA